MKSSVAATLAGVGLALSGAAQAQPAAVAKPISVARIVASIPEGRPWGNITYGLGCLGGYQHLTWGVGAGRLNARAFEQPARAELKSEGFTVSGDPDSPFGEESSADTALGGTITAIKGDFCIGLTSTSATSMKGSTSIEVDWQVYSNIERRVVATVHTKGAGHSDVSREGGFQTLLIAALDDSLKGLTASDDFKRVITSGPPNTSPAPSGARSALTLTGSLAAKPAKISDAIGSVVLILSNGGHGSGFLLSSDGYLMTAEHVVGADKYVKVRWSDGLEGVGEVIRTDKRRDVALIKVDPRGRQPLALRREAPQPGDTVFAIGAPIDPKLQNTVTRGVASANRIMDGFSFIQSDVTVDPGNSGGPLLNDKGEVLGFTDIGIRTAEAPTGLNFFVPIGDALLFLSAEPH